MKNATVFVDLGLTLLETDREPLSKEGWIQVDPALVVFPTMIRVRPSARKFLEEQKAAGRFIITFSSSDIDTQFAYLMAAGLAELVDEMSDPIPTETDFPWVLVDDDDLPESKLCSLGIDRVALGEEEFLRQVAAHHVRCTKFSQFADKTDSAPLSELSAEIEQKLAAQ